jgi:tripartite-type tricarboxylate transporter receptor subunit TctC
MAGAATIQAHNYIFNTAEPDGLTICLTNWAHLAGAWLTDEEAAKWEPIEYEYLGAIQRLESVFMVKADGPYNSIEDLQQAKNLKLATTTPAGSAGVSGSILAEILGLDVKIIAGYPGSRALLLAVSQGEVAGCAFPSDSAYLYTQEGLIKPLFVINYREYEVWDIPTLADLVQLSEDDRKLLDLQVLAIKPWIAPPGTPEDRVEFLGAMLYECAQDEGLIKTVTRLYGFWGGALNAEEAQSMFAVAASPETKAAFQEELQPLVDKYAA